MTTPKRNSSHDVVAALLVEHRHVARLLDVLEQQSEAAAGGAPIDRDALRSVMHYMTEFPDTYHHPREDAMFVRLAKRDPGLRKCIAAIERAHRTIGEAGKELLAAAQRAPGRRADESGLAARIRDYVGAQREHMTIEERDLFPRARQLLDAADLAAIERDFRRMTDPIFEASVRDAYAAYPALVRMLVEQPAVRQALDLVDSFYESASTFGELLFGGAAAQWPSVLEPGQSAGGRARRGAAEPKPARRSGKSTASRPAP
jgi:hemerythrin-like domain-containing protein